MEDLVIESIKQYGADVYYLPRTPLSEADNIYGEYPGSIFTAAYPIEMYLEDVVERASGGGEFFSKFGLEIRDPLKLIVARRSFQKYVPIYTRPREGDLIYVPQLTNLYEIKFVEEEKDFFSLGRRPPMQYYYELQIELFKFSNERFSTGILDIDQVAIDYSYTIHLTMNTGGAGAFTKGEKVYQGVAAANATISGIVKDWDRTNKTLDIITVKGVFANGVSVKGNTSGSNYVLSTYDRQSYANVSEEYVTNTLFQDEADDIIDFETGNPFGVPNGNP